MPSVHIYLSDEQLEHLDSYCDKMGAKRSWIVQRALALFIDGLVDVPFLGTISVKGTDWDRIREKVEESNE